LDLLAKSTASELGADIPATDGIPAAKDFCINSKEIRPLNKRV
jgi:hypothetical protein